MDKDSEVTSDRYFNKTRGNLEKIVEDLKYYGVGSLLNLARPFVTSKKEKEIDDKIEAARKNRKDRKESIDKEVIREEKNELDRQMEISKLKYQIFKMKDSPEKKLLENRLHNLIRESDTLEGFYKVVFSSNKNDKDIKEFLTTPKEREKYRQREINKLKYQIFNEKDPNEKIALESRMKYLIRESNQLDSFLENGKEFLHSAAKQAPEGALKGLAFSAASKVKMSGPLLFLLTSENLNSNEDAVLRDMRKKNIKDISPDEEKYIKDFPEYYEDENIASRINILKTEWNKTERNNDIANYYSNKGTDISRGLGSFVGDFGGMIAGGIAGEIAISKTTNTFRGNLNISTNINNYKEFPNKVFINDGTPGGTTIAHQIRATDSSGNMIKLQNNLTTGELSLQGINSSGQRIFEKSLTPYKVNSLIGTSSSSQMLVGNGVVSKVVKLPYKSVLALPVKYPIKSESGVTLRGANNTKKIVSSTDTPIPKIEVETPNIKDNSFNKLKPINLDKLKVVENSTPEEANLYWRKNAGYTNKPYDENYEVKLVKNNGEKFVRVYTPSMGTRKASAWFMREKDIIGLTPEEIKDKYALPYTPTHVVDVKIGSVIIRTGVVKEVEGWGKGKGQQFDTNGTRLSEKQFINEREIGEKYEKK